MAIIARPQVDCYEQDVAAAEICYACEHLQNAMRKHGCIDACFAHCAECKWAARWVEEED